MPRPPSTPRARAGVQLGAFALVLVAVLGVWRLVEGDGVATSPAAVPAGGPVSGTTSPPAAGAGPSTTAAAAEPALAATTAAPATTVPPPTSGSSDSAGAVLRTPTADDPLRVYIAGDSLAQGYGTFLQRLAEKTGVIDTTLDVKASTGLTRPDFFDWPAHLSAGLAAKDPEVVVVTFGGNDAQPIRVDGTSYDVEAPEWQAEYARRVGSAMDLAATGGRQVVWVGTPNARSASFTTRLAVLNRIYAEEAAERPDTVTYVDAWELLSAPGGGYTDSRADRTGKVVKMRAGDGIHLNVAGATFLAQEVLDRIGELALLPADG